MEKQVKITRKRKLDEKEDAKPRKKLAKTVEPTKSKPRTVKEIKLKTKSQSVSAKTEKILLQPSSTISDEKADATEGSVDLWDESIVLAQVEKIPEKLAKNLVSLLSEGCTLPFIARYRKTAVDNLMPDRLQELYETYQNVIQLKKKSKKCNRNIKKIKEAHPGCREKYPKCS